MEMEKGKLYNIFYAGGEHFVNTAAWASAADNFIFIALAKKSHFHFHFQFPMRKPLTEKNQKETHTGTSTHFKNKKQN